MLRTLVLLLLLSAGVHAAAQMSIHPVISGGVDVVDYTHIGAPMPFLKLLKYDDKGSAQGKSKSGKMLTGKDFSNDANLFVILFNPNCSNCEDETEYLEKNIALFKNTKIVMVADPLTAEYVPMFARGLKIANYPAITLGIDSSAFIGRIFLKKELPQINIYNPQRVLIKTFSGGALLDSLRQYIQ